MKRVSGLNAGAKPFVPKVSIIVVCLIILAIRTRSQICPATGGAGEAQYTEIRGLTQPSNADALMRCERLRILGENPKGQRGMHQITILVVAFFCMSKILKFESFTFGGTVLFVAFAFFVTVIP